MSMVYVQYHQELKLNAGQATLCRLKIAPFWTWPELDCGTQEKSVLFAKALRTCSMPSEKTETEPPSQGPGREPVCLSERRTYPHPSTPRFLFCVASTLRT